MRRSEKRRRVSPDLRAGVNASPIRLPQADFATVGEWFEQRFPSEGLAAFDRGDVLAGHGIEIGPDYPYTPGERLWIFRPILDEPSEPIVLRIVAENERYVVVDKPHLMASVPKGSHVAHTALVAARRQLGNDLLVAAHRLDLETAGLLLLIKDPQWRGAYQKLFEGRRITKTYEALAPLIQGAHVGQEWDSDLRLRKVEGEMSVEVLRNGDDPSEGEEASFVGETGSNDVTPGPADFYYGEHRRARVRVAPHVVTHIVLSERVAPNVGKYTLYPHTGFTHQLRVAMNELGAPILGDPTYPRIMTLEEVAQRPYPLQLVARTLEFVDPVTHETVHLESREGFEQAIELGL